MNYIDDFISEQTERNKLAGLVQEFHIVTAYDTVDDIPPEALDAIIELIKSGRGHDAKSQFKSLLDKVRNLDMREAQNIGKALNKIARDEIAAIQ